MVEDKRVKKTKKNLKQTMISLLSQKPFEQITVKELCDASETSRLTFYAHFADKYELMDAIFQDMVDLARVDFYRLQAQRNTDGDAARSLCNLLECILNLFEEHEDFFKHTLPEESPYLNTAFIRYTLLSVEKHISQEEEALRLRYSLKKTAAFITYGLWGFINASQAGEGITGGLRAEVAGLLTDLMHSGAILEERGK